MSSILTWNAEFFLSFLAGVRFLLLPNLKIQIHNNTMVDLDELHSTNLMTGSPFQVE